VRSRGCDQRCCFVECSSDDLRRPSGRPGPRPQAPWSDLILCLESAGSDSCARSLFSEIMPSLSMGAGNEAIPSPSEIPKYQTLIGAGERALGCEWRVKVSLVDCGAPVTGRPGVLPRSARHRGVLRVTRYWRARVALRCRKLHAMLSEPRWGGPLPCDLRHRPGAQPRSVDGSRGGPRTRARSPVRCATGSRNSCDTARGGAQ
jgi:hypothetical protein